MTLKNNKADRKELQVTFDRSLGFFDATMIGIGAMIGAGIFVLTGIAAGVSGPASLLAFALNGLITLITAFAYAELASSIPESGGGYSYVKYAFPDVFAFVAGWWLWFAYTVACALYAAGFGAYLMEFLGCYLPGTHGLLVGLAGEQAAVVAMIILGGVTFVSLNVRGAMITGKTENVIVVAKVAVLVVFIIFGIEAIIGDVPAAKAEFKPFFPQGIGSVFIAMGLTFIAFEGYDLIATVAEEIKEPEKNIPRAIFVSVGVTVLIYLCVIFVSLGAVHPGDMPSWEFLGKYQETGIIRVAAKMMPAAGAFLIVMGGLLSTMSALNATIMASSRVAFSMARNEWLPPRLAAIHARLRTPHIAILITGVLFLIVAVCLPISLLGSAASVMFLLVFAMVNLAVVALRRKQPALKRRYTMPLYPVLPLLGFVINLLLAVFQYRFDRIPWTIVGGWTAVGLFLYIALFQHKIKARRPLVLRLEKTTPPEQRERFRVLVPLHNPATVRYLISIAAALSIPRNGEIVALTVAVVPEQLPIHEGVVLVDQRRPLIREAQACALELGADLRGDLRVAHSLSHAMLDSVQDHHCNLLVMGWKGFPQQHHHIFGEITDYMLRHCPCDVAVIKADSADTISRILLATSGGPHATLGAAFARDIAGHYGASVDACVVVPEKADRAGQEAALERISKSLKTLDPQVKIGRYIVKSGSIAAGIAKASQEFELVVVGAAAGRPFVKMVAGDIPERVARSCPGPVMVVRRWPGPATGLFRKLFG